MGKLTPTGLETTTYGMQGWDAIETANAERLNRMLGSCSALWDGSAQDGQVVQFNAGAEKWTTADMQRQPRGVVHLDDAPTVAVDMTQGNVFELTLGGDRILGAPTGAVDGATYYVVLRQDAVGGHSVTFDPVWLFSGALPPVSAAPGHGDLVRAICVGGVFVCCMVSDFDLSVAE